MENESSEGGGGSGRGGNVVISSTPGNGNNKQPPVLLMHALMQDSESFLCGGEHSLALFLAEAGFDVWLGK